MLGPALVSCTEGFEVEGVDRIRMTSIGCGGGLIEVEVGANTSVVSWVCGILCIIGSEISSIIIGGDECKE